MTASYEQDYGLWAEQMADLLASGRFSELDIENLVEEVRDLSKWLTHSFLMLCLIRRSQSRISVKNILLVIRSRSVTGCCGMRSRMGLGLFGDRIINLISL